MSDDMKLVVELKNERPVELTDFARSMIAFGREYERFVQGERPEVDAAEAKLYVKEIRPGSIVAELVPLAPFALPLLQYGFTALEYAEKIQKIVNWLLGNDEKPQHIEKTTLDNMCQFVEPVAKDHGSQLNVGALNNNGTLVLNINLDSTQAAALQNNARRELEQLHAPSTGIHREVVMYWAQAKNQAIGANSDRARIESIYPGDVKVRFASNEMKIEALYGPDHPFSRGYIVDVQVETIRGKPVLYRCCTFMMS